ncbi:hypothetical protein [Paenibacillus xerothermodurans]|uniref:Uncharacterized protein n=1 Tax=Paenibacillus xerothermodurans TaxID=1977292 RepID=A0A2W1N4E9_PAEXE|nr:hypothetical protein [Paenibacillus xerothermodurans]PZE19629.1 hypothetical protein CBW46_016915 [Paenibacillus xerothermodurans]
MKEETVVAGRVAYDVENREWVMYVEDKFVPMEQLFGAVDSELDRQGLPQLRVGDELVVLLRRNKQ